MNNEITELRKRISASLSFSIDSRIPRYKILQTKNEKTYARNLISYKGNENDEIKAFLYLPYTNKQNAGILIHHQHNSEYHLGKSEVAGIAGNKFQAFAPALAKMGFTVLVPDRITFEDRRKNCKGLTIDKFDWHQHYNEFCYRLINGKLLITKVLNDSTIALNLLANLKTVNANKLMVVGHSDGGNNALFQSALDTRITYCCASGSLCSYKCKILNQTGISMMLMIPFFLKEFEMNHLVKCIAPRHLLLLSADRDKYSMDSDKIYNRCKEIWGNQQEHILHNRYHGEHALNGIRFNDIINWISNTIKP